MLRLANGMAKRYLNMNIDSSQYVRPAIAYFQELVNLASEKGFIMSRINARELSNRLNDIINNDIISPILKVNISLIQLQNNNFFHIVNYCPQYVAVFLFHFSQFRYLN